MPTTTTTKRLKLLRKTVVKKESNVIHAEEGESVNITCQFLSSNIDGLYLKRTLLKPIEVLYATKHGEQLTLKSAYINRTKYFELQDRAIIMLQQVQKDDSDVYVCEHIDKDFKEMKTRGVILAVRDKSVMKLEQCSSSPQMLVVIILALLLACALGYFILFHMDVKKYCRKGKRMEIQTIIYEDMNGCKHNNSHVPNVYQN
ncbi:uncharacterized protein [Tiliqua scincoides]|uniref:uncharacterized protein isoform X2 n=1 Tax=Tiliqua scincoides TaxID=71010 RepID=UPI0034618D86